MQNSHFMPIMDKMSIKLLYMQNKNISINNSQIRSRGNSKFAIPAYILMKSYLMHYFS